MVKLFKGCFSKIKSFKLVLVDTIYFAHIAEKKFR